MYLSARSKHVSTVCFSLLVFCLPMDTWADSLTISTSEDSFQLYEPIILNLTLHLDPPYQIILDDPLEATRQQRRLIGRFEAELRDGNETLCSTLLSGAPFTPLRNGQTDFHVTALGCLGTQKSAAPRNEFFFWDRPGKFILVVRDPLGGMESNEIAIEFTEPENDDAAELFRSGRLDTLMLIHQQYEHSEAAVPIFEKLAEDFPDSAFGKYARMSLALRRADPESWLPRRSEMDSGKFQALAADLKEAISLFKPGHPLRNRALFHLARVQPATGTESIFEQTLRQLSSETHDEYWIHTAQWNIRDRH